MPAHIKIHNASNDPCDVLTGPCACGASHKINDWDGKIHNVQQYIKKQIKLKK